MILNTALSRPWQLWSRDTTAVAKMISILHVAHPSMWLSWMCTSRYQCWNDILCSLNLRHYLMTKKSVKWLHLLLLVGGVAENRERVVEGRGFFPRILIHLECQKNTLFESEHILMLICAALGRFPWSLWELDVASVFFSLHIVSKSPAEIHTHWCCCGIALSR